MIRLAAAAMAGGAMLCAATDVSAQALTAADFAEPSAAASFLQSRSAITAPAASYALTDRSQLDDLTGASWRGGATPLGGDTELSVFMTDVVQFQRPGGALPGEAFALSDPALAADVDSRAMQLNVETRAFSTEAGGLDFQLSPRVGMASGYGQRSAGAGVVARLGQNLNDYDSSEPAWFLFAGYGRKAVKIDPTRSHFGLADAQVRRQAIVGDAQAGLALDLGPADLALTYMRRERSVAKDGWGEGRHDGFALLSLNFLN